MFINLFLVSFLYFYSTSKIFGQRSRLENPDCFLSLGGFFIYFAFDFVCVGCLVVGCFALLTRVLQSRVGFWGWNYTWGLNRLRRTSRFSVLLLLW